MVRLGVGRVLLWYGSVTTECFAQVLMEPFAQVLMESFVRPDARIAVICTVSPNSTDSEAVALTLTLPLALHCPPVTPCSAL